MTTLEGMWRGLTLSVCAAGFGALAAEGLEKWKLSAAEVETPLYDAIVAGDLGFIPGNPTVKALPREVRVAVVNAAGAVAKAFVKSAAFKSRYERWRAGQLPARPAPARTREQLVKSAKDDAAEQRRQFEASIKGLPKGSGSQVQAMRQQFEASLKLKVQHAGSHDAEDAEALRHAEEMNAWNVASERIPKNPMVRVKGLLEKFLEQTKEVDFDAALKADGRFKEYQHEAKSAVWKAAYRAGPEATKAARTFALQWLRELK